MARQGCVLLGRDWSLLQPCRRHLQSWRLGILARVGGRWASLFSRLFPCLLWPRISACLGRAPVFWVCSWWLSALRFCRFPTLFQRRAGLLILCSWAVKNASRGNWCRVNARVVALCYSGGICKHQHLHTILVRQCSLCLMAGVIAKIRSIMRLRQQKRLILTSCGRSILIRFLRRRVMPLVCQKGRWVTAKLVTPLLALAKL